eukprot:834411-Prymnesium_polylepis.1
MAALLACGSVRGLLTTISPVSNSTAGRPAAVRTATLTAVLPHASSGLRPGVVSSQPLIAVAAASAI